MAFLGAKEPVKAESRLVLAGLATYFVVSLVIALCSAGTYDAGDSVMHYQFAHYSFQHPINLLNHWAKPFFTLMAAPFSALGFSGMKLFQCLLAIGSGWLVYRSARKLSLPWPWMAPILTLAAPEFFLSQLSGLTEPLFAFLLILGVHSVLHEKHILGALVFSFLPYVRTEGFLVLPAIGIYLLLGKQWKAIPFLGAGTAVYALLGGIFLGDFLWIWTKNPYAANVSSYGIGGLMHFPEKYVFISGIPIYVLTIIGLAFTLFQILNPKGAMRREWLLVVLGPWAIYLGAHMYFWASGTGHSMGLLRVLIGILPLGALMATLGLGKMLHWIPGNWSKTRVCALVAILLYVVAFPVIPNPASIRSKELRLTEDQKMIQSVAEYIQTAGLQNRKMYSAHPSVSYFCGIDPFDPQRYRSLSRLKDDSLATSTLILLDSWFGKVESGYDNRFFDAQPNAFRRLQSWTGAEGNTPISLTLYEKI